MTGSNDNETVTSGEIQLYATRWLIMGCLGLQSILLSMSKYYFGLVNNIFRDFFGISYAKVDWFTLSSNASTWMFCAVWTFLSLAKPQQFRRMSIVAAVCAFVGSMCAMVAFVWRSLYVFLYAGGLFIGVLSGFLLIAPVSFIVLWFPDNEVGTALSLRFAAARLGLVLAFIIPTHILSPLSCNKVLADQNNSANISFTCCKSSWIHQQRSNFLIYQGSLTLLALALLVVLIFLAADQPPKPPTNAQALLRQQNANIQPLNLRQQTLLYVEEMKLLFSDVTFLNIVVSVSILYAQNTFQVLFMSELMRPIFGGYFRSNPDEISSYLVILYEVGAIVGSIISGQIMNRMKNYVLLVRIGFLMTIVCTVGLILSYYFKQIPFIFICNSLLGLCASFIFSPIFEFSTQYTYPRPTDFVLSCLAFGFRPLVILLSELFRLVLNDLDGFSVLVFYSLSFACGLFLAVFLKPQYRRLEAESNATDNLMEHEAQPLLSNDDDNHDLEK